MEVRIYGYGWVGKAMHTLFPNAILHDPALNLIDEKSYEFTDVSFVCVPTPLKNGKLDCSIVESVVKDCKSDLIIIRSTVMPGTCDKLEHLGKNIVFQPEYLGETPQHPMSDQHHRPFLILGGRPKNRRKAIELYQTVYSANIKIRQVTNYEAEVIKLSENRAIAFKVAQCQELYDVCEAVGVDYYTIRDAVYSDDPRFNLWHTFVFPDKRGFNSKCIPKDVYGWAAWAESLGYKPKLTNKMLEINDQYIKTWN
jgi:UDPglucose 6-dehydrogenase